MAQAVTSPIIDYMADVAPTGLRRSPAISSIQREVCSHFSLPALEMVSQRRSRVVTRPRQIAMFLCRELTPHSLPMIGRHFGGRDHTTVMHAISVIERLIGSDAEIADHVGELRKRLQPTAWLKEG